MKKAIYHYRTSDYQGGYIPHSMRVEIVGESDKSYQVKYLEFHANGSRPGTTTWVRKNNIKNISDAPDVRTSPALNWLPYKD